MAGHGRPRDAAAVSGDEGCEFGFGCLEDAPRRAGGLHGLDVSPAGPAAGNGADHPSRWGHVLRDG